MRRRAEWLLAGLLVLTGCSSPNEESGKQNTDMTVEQYDDPLEADYPRDNSAGSRTKIGMDEAASKKEAGESFVLMYTKQDCSYCASFDEVLAAYLPNHHLDIYEVDLTEAEEKFSEEEIAAMADTLTAGIDKTPALYYILSPSNVNMLYHSESNYSSEGLDQWVIANELDKAE